MAPENVFQASRMESKDALAFVNYKYFRSSPENRQRYSRAFFYISKKPRVLDLVGGGGRLRVITSSRKKRGPRIYSLAYRLTDCAPFEVWPHLQETFGNLGVTADPDDCRHFPGNDVTDLLMDFEFVPRKPIAKRASIGMSLMTARELSPRDVGRMVSYEDKLLHGKSVFVSYSREDMRVADSLQDELELSGHSVWRDVRSIVGGDHWEREISRAIENADSLIVIVSRNSAASEWVPKEIAIATKLLGRPSKIKRVIPLVIDQGAWLLFPDLQPFQKVDESGDGAGIRQIADQLRDDSG